VRPAAMFAHRYPVPACSSVFLQKLIVAQIMKIFPALCGTRRFITVLTTASPLLYPKPENTIPKPYII
jgi:hypothetical protein